MTHGDENGNSEHPDGHLETDVPDTSLYGQGIKPKHTFSYLQIYALVNSLIVRHDYMLAIQLSRQIGYQKPITSQ